MLQLKLKLKTTTSQLLKSSEERLTEENRNFSLAGQSGWRCKHCDSYRRALAADLPVVTLGFLSTCVTGCFGRPRRFGLVTKPLARVTKPMAAATLRGPLSARPHLQNRQA